MKYYFPVTTTKILPPIQAGRENREAPISWMKYVIEVKVEKSGTLKK